MTLTASDQEFIRLAGKAHESGLKQMRLRSDHRQTLAGLMTVACSDCFCHDCICADVADWNSEEVYNPDCRRCEDVGCVHCR